MRINLHLRPKDPSGLRHSDRYYESKFLHSSSMCAPPVRMLYLVLFPDEDGSMCREVHRVYALVNDIESVFTSAIVPNARRPRECSTVEGMEAAGWRLHSLFCRESIFRVLIREDVDSGPFMKSSEYLESFQNDKATVLVDAPWSPEEDASRIPSIFNDMEMELREAIDRRDGADSSKQNG